MKRIILAINKIFKFKSVAIWPTTIKVGNTVGKNESEDFHRTEDEALGVCKLLMLYGYGGDGKVFPLSTRVELIQDSERN